MPVLKCSNGKYRIGEGPCVFHSKEKAERAYKAYNAIKHMKQTGSKVARGNWEDFFSPSEIKYYRDDLGYSLNRALDEEYLMEMPEEDYEEYVEVRHPNRVASVDQIIKEAIAEVLGIDKEASVGFSFSPDVAENIRRWADGLDYELTYEGETVYFWSTAYARSLANDIESNIGDELDERTIKEIRNLVKEAVREVVSDDLGLQAQEVAKMIYDALAHDFNIAANFGLTRTIGSNRVTLTDVETRELFVIEVRKGG